MLEDRIAPAVNQAPFGIANTVTTLEDTPAIVSIADFGFSDPDNHQFAGATLTNLNIAGTFTNNGVAVQNGDFVSASDILAGLLILTPTPDANGTALAWFDFQVRDDGGTADDGVDTDPTPRTMTFDVTPVNDAPSFSAANPPIVDANPDLWSIPGWATFNPGGGPDEAQQAAIYTVTNVSNPDLFTELPTVAPDGTLTYAVNSNFEGISTFDVQVQDSGGTDHNGVNQSNTTTFMVHVISTISWTGGGDGASWHVSANWDSYVVPGPFHDVVINYWEDAEITVHVGIDATVRSLHTNANITVLGSLAATTGRITNTGAITFYRVPNLSFDAANVIRGPGVVNFIETHVGFSGPVTTESDLRFYTQSHALTIDGDVTVRKLLLDGGVLQGPGNLTLTQEFRWNWGIISGAGTTTVGPTAKFIVDFTNMWRYLYGPYNLIVQGTREEIQNPSAPAWAVGFNLFHSPNDGVYEATFNNLGIPPRTNGPTGPAPFNAMAAARSIFNAMYGGSFGGVNDDEDAIYAAMEPIRSQADVDLLFATYAQLYPGRNVINDLQANLSGDELNRVQALWNVDWNRYVAHSIHEAIYTEWSLHDIDLICRLLSNSRSDPARIESNYAFQYGPPFADANTYLRNDLTSRLTQSQTMRVTALLDGNPARSEAAAIRGLITFTSAQLPTAEAMFELLRNHTPAQIQAIREQYAILVNGSISRFDTDLADYFNSWPDWLGGVENNLQHLNALLSGDRIAIAVTNLHRAMDRLGTDEDLVWKTLDGLYADERARVALAYRAQYNKTLMQEFTEEFRDSGIYGNELQKTLLLYERGGLTRAQRIFFAVQGWGTSDPELQAALGEIRTMTGPQLALLREQYLAFGGESLDDAILGDLTGREDFEAGMDLRGSAESVQVEVMRQNERLAYERGGYLNLTTNAVMDSITLNLYTSSFNPLTQHAQRLEAETARANELCAQLSAATDDTERARLQNEVRNAVRLAEQHLQTFREARDATADLFASTLSTAAAVAVTIGTAGAATPMLIVALAAGSAGAGFQTLGRILISGGIDLEQLPVDYAAGFANGATSALTFFGPASNLTRFQHILRGAADGALSGGLGGFVNGAVNAAVHDSTWEQGLVIGLARVGEAGAVGLMVGAPSGAAIGSLAGALRRIPALSQGASDAYYASMGQREFIGQFAQQTHATTCVPTIFQRILGAGTDLSTMFDAARRNLGYYLDDAFRYFQNNNLLPSAEYVQTMTMEALASNAAQGKRIVISVTNGGSGAHALLIEGWDAATGRFMVSDPLTGSSYWQTASLLEARRLASQLDAIVIQ